jgi:hypothetical protein
MPKLKFKEPITWVTTALGLPGQPHRVEAGFEMDVTDEIAASAKKVYEDRVEIIPDKLAASTGSSKKEK